MSGFCKSLKRNKNKLIYLAGCIGGGYAIFKITKYIQYYSKKNETNSNLDFKILKAHYFQTTLINSLETIENILKNVEKEIELIMDPENIASSLGVVYKSSSQSIEYNKQQHSSLSANEKLELWKKFKVLSFTKFTLLVYCWSFICIIIHIQMSILAGNLFQTKNVTPGYFGIFNKYFELIFSSNKARLKIAEEDFRLEFINFTLQTLKSQLCNWRDLIQKVSYETVESISLKQMLTSDNMLEIFGKIKDGVHNDILELFLHDIQSKNSNKPMEANMYGLFANVLESNGIGQINDFISLLSKHISSSLYININSLRNIGEIETLEKVPLAKLVPFIWTSFNNKTNQVTIFNSIRGFFSTPKFRFMLFSAYENSMDKINI